MAFDFSRAEERKQTPYWNFKDKAVFEGILKQIIVTEKGTEWLVTTENNEDFKVGSYSALKDKLTNKDLGKPVHIEFVDEVRGKNKRDYMTFKVLVA